MNLALLSAGGIGAMLLAGLQQVRSFFAYVSSFVIVHASYNTSLSLSVLTHLKLNYKRLPSGQFVYLSMYIRVRGRESSSLIPFRVPSDISIYARGGRLLFVKISESTLEIRTLRGFDFDAFTSEAIDTYENLNRVSAGKRSRFYVNKIVGSEKVSSNHRQTVHGVGSDSESALNSPSTRSGAMWEINPYLDKSFKYDSESFAYRKDDDPLEGLFFDDEVLKYLKQAEQWINMGSWYLERQIPWRRGWLMYGPGGTGKSSMAKATAQKLGIPCYQYFLATLSDQEFMEAWEGMATPCAVLFEDFDTVFNLRESVTEHKALTFDCVLNQISGVSALDGVFLMVTTNRLEMIDPAMGVTCELGGVSTRPGRIDAVIKIGYINEANKRKMATKVLRDWPEVIEQVLEEHKGKEYTPGQFQEICIQEALPRMQFE